MLLLIGNHTTMTTISRMVTLESDLVITIHPPGTGTTRLAIPITMAGCMDILDITAHGATGIRITTATDMDILAMIRIDITVATHTSSMAKTSFPTEQIKREMPDIAGRATLAPGGSRDLPEDRWEHRLA